MAVINSFRCVKRAEYRHGDRNHCFKGSCRGILDDIQFWTHDFTKSPVYWLNGLAGTGKSTIAQTIAEKLFVDGRLGASFFCSRNFEDRSDLKFILQTLTVQLARLRRVSINIHSPRAIESRNCPRVPVHGEVDSIAPHGIWHIDGHRNRRPTRMQGRRKRFSSPAHSWTVRDKDSKGQILPYRSPRYAHSGRNPVSAACRSNRRVILYEVRPDQVNNDVRLLFAHNSSGHASGRRALGGWPTK